MTRLMIDDATTLLGLPLFAQALSRGTWKPYPYLKYLASQVCGAIIRGNGRIIISLPPRHGKSELMSKYLPLWFLHWFPTDRIILTSYQAEFAAEWTRKCRNLAHENQDLLGFRISPDLMRADNWATTDGGGMYSAGTGGAITGRGADLIIVDDPTKNWEEAYSEAVKRRTNDWFDSTLITRAEPGCTVIVIMTRWSQDDLAGHLMGMGGWSHIALPALAEPDDPLGRPVGEALCPERFNATELESIRLHSTGSHKFAAMYQQRPAPIEGAIWKRIWFLRTWRELPKVDEIIQSWDLTFGLETASGSFNVGQVWGRRGKDKYLLDQVRFRGTFTEQLSAIKAMAAKWPRTRRIVIEDAAAARAVVDTLKSSMSSITLEKPNGSKEMRAIDCTPELESGRIIIPDPSVLLWVNGWIDEVTTAPGSAYTDQWDAASQALRYLRKKRRLRYGYNREWAKD